MDFSRSGLLLILLILRQPMLCWLWKGTFVIFRFLIEFICSFRPFLVFLPWWVAQNHVKFSQLLQFVILQVGFNIDRRMISFFSPCILLLHQLGQTGIFIVPDWRINILNKVLGPFTSFRELGIEAMVLHKLKPLHISRFNFLQRWYPFVKSLLKLEWII